MTDSVKALGYAMSTCFVITFIAIVFYIVRLIVYKKLRNFMSSLIAVFMFSDIIASLGAFLRYTPSLEGNSGVVCNIGAVLLFGSNIVSFLYSSAICISFLGALMVNRNSLFDLLNKTRWQVAYHLLIILLAVIWTCITFFFGRDSSSGCWSYNSWFLCSIWLAVLCFNFTVVFIVYRGLRLIATESNSRNSRNGRIVISICLLVGVLRIPSFILTLLTKNKLVESMESNPSLAIGAIFSFCLLVLQSFFIVAYISWNQRVCDKCSGSYATSESEEESKRAKVVPADAKKHSTTTLSDPKGHDEDEINLTENPSQVIIVVN